jgi:hypothetical protein
VSARAHGLSEAAGEVYMQLCHTCIYIACTCTCAQKHAFICIAMAWARPWARRWPTPAWSSDSHGIFHASAWLRSAFPQSTYVCCCAAMKLVLRTLEEQAPMPPRLTFEQQEEAVLARMCTIDARTYVHAPIQSSRLCLQKACAYVLEHVSAQLCTAGSSSTLRR